MGRRGPEPDHAKREAFARLISEGVPSVRASRMVGIDTRTGKRWRNGRMVRSGGREDYMTVFPRISGLAQALAAWQSGEANC